MTILQWNLNGYSTQSGELRRLIKQFEPKIIALQETKFKPTNSPTIQGYSLFRKDFLEGLRACGGVALFIKSTYSPRAIDLQTDVQAVAAQLTLSNLHLTICNIYIPAGETIPEQEIKRIRSQLPSPFVICGDFNAHNPLWGGSKIDTNGKIMENFLMSDQIVLLNGLEHTHFSQSHQTFSSIDLTICTQNILHRAKWFVHADLCSSDHFPIITNIENAPTTNKPDTMQPQQPKWRVDKADWEKFKKLCQIEEALPQDPQQTLDLIIGKILYAASKCIPQAGPKINKRAPVPWWNEECRAAISQRIKAFKKYKKDPKIENFIEFKKSKAKARWIIKNAKAASWKKFVEQFSSETPSSVVWKNVRKISANSQSIHIPTVIHNNKLISDDKEKANILAASFQHYSSNENYPASFSDFKSTQEAQPIAFSPDNSEPYNAEFTMTEFNKVLKNLKNSAPGPDHVHNLMLQNLPDDMRRKLLELLNTFWKTGFFPEQWRNAIIIPIPKNNLNRLEPSNYRPISLTSAVCKLYEQLIATRLTWFLDQNNLLTNIQCGARKGRSTYDHLLKLQAQILNGFSHKQFTAAIFFDLQKAYDSTWRYKILKTLKKWGLKGNLPIFIKQFLSERFFQVKINSVLSEKFKQINGIPQGSVLSVILFLIAINDISECLPHSVDGSLFVDDFAIYITTKNTKIAKGLLSKCLRNLEKWSLKTGFTFSISKTTAIIFTRKHKIPKMSLRLHNNPIAFQTSAKFLGLQFDRKLLWKEHITNLKNECSKRMRILKYLSHTSWGADKETMLTLYRSFIRSKLDYGSFIYGTASQSILNTLNTVQNTCLRLITGAFRTSPASSLCIEAQEPPLHLRRKYLLGKYMAKLKCCKTHPTYAAIFELDTKSPLTSSVTSEANFEDIIPSTTLNFPPWIAHELDIRLDSSAHPKSSVLPCVLRQDFYAMLAEYSEHEQIFTDGSKLHNFTGCAVVTTEDAFQYKLSPDCTIFTAEAIAILKALEYVESSKSQKSIICSDSYSVLSSLQSSSPSHPILIQMHNILQQLLQNRYSITLCWSPGHVGIEGNSRADKNAKEAALMVGPYLPSASSDDKQTFFKHKLTKDWESEWREQQHLNRLSQLTSGRVTHHQSATVKNTRRDQVILSRLKIGHTHFSHSHLIEGKEKPQCQTCNTALTVDHVLLDCSAYQQIRLKLKLQNCSLYDLLFSSDHTMNTLKFIKETKLIV